MVNVINSSQNYNVSNGKIKQENIQTNLAKSKQVVSDNFESNSAVQVLGNSKDPNSTRNTVLLIPPLMILDDIVNKTMAGIGNKSILNKIANLGDKISNKLNLDKVFSSSKRKNISNFLNNNRFTKYFTNNFKANSILAKNHTMAEKYTGEVISGLEKLQENPAFKEALENGEIKLKETTLNILESLTDNAVKSKLSPEKLLDATDDIIKNGIDTVKAGGLLGGGVSLSEVSNKLKASSSKIGETSLGKVLSKGTVKAKDELTYGGGLLGLAFTANALVHATKEAKDAPKGEKLCTFMHVLSEQYVGIILFQPCTNLLYKIGGNKYRGMTQEGREALTNLVKNTNANRELTKEGLKIAKMQRDLLIKGVDKDKVAELAGKGLKEAKTMANSLKKEGAKIKLWEKPLKFMGKILDAGLDKMQKPTFKKLPIVGEVKIPKPTLKGFAGGLGRFMLICFVLQPILQKPITKLFHKIFGEPKTYLAKQKANEKSGKKAENQSVNQAGISSDNNSSQSTNLLERYTSPQPQVQTENNTADEQKTDNGAASQVANAQTSIASNDQSAANESIPALFLNKKSKETERYIPSIETNFTQDDSSEKELEKRANEILKSTDNLVKKSKKLLG